MSTPRVGRIPVWGSHIYPDLWGLHGELLQEDVWAGFFCKVSSGEHCGAPKLMSTYSGAFALLLLCHGGGGRFPQGCCCTLLGCCPRAGLGCSWINLLGIELLFSLGGGKKAEQAPLDGVRGEFLYVSFCMIVLGMIHWAKTCFCST